MKKHIIIFSVILIAIYGVLTLLDTSEYRVEKEMWRMHKQYAKISEDPKAVPGAQYDRVIKKYLSLIKKFPDSRYVPQMYSLIGSLHLMNNEFDQARKVFGQVATEFKDTPDVAAKAFMDVANVYLMEKKVTQAVDIYNRIWDNYSETEVGFLAPFHIIKIYISDGQTVMAERYLAKAVKFYKTIAQDKSNHAMLRLKAYQMLANAYIGQKKWDAALQTTETMLNEFADTDLITPQRLSGIARILNLIAVIKLDDFDRARGIYQDFINTHPEHFLNKYLEKIIETLNLIENKKMQSVTSQ